MSDATFTFKIASQPEEFEQIHQLNYQTFVEEIPQHPTNTEKRRIDKFHAENQYCICLVGQQLVGMLAVRGQRPFSLDEKVPNLDSWLPANQQLCEIRLLSILPAYRKSNLFTGLLLFAAQQCIRAGYTMAVISGTLRQTRLYQHIGFVPFSEPVGTKDALYQPMYLTLAAVQPLLTKLHGDATRTISFLPGPVEISPAVMQALAAPAISHRSAAYQHLLADTQARLQVLTGARGVQILVGSGTLANDVVAAQLHRLSQKGLLLCNGEFGERLVEHARRMGLDYVLHAQPWGQPFDLAAIEQQLENKAEIGWLWCVHCETSTGMLNDLAALQALCKRHDLKLALDCISSLGVAEVDLSDVFLASGVSNKGMAAIAGLSLVFYNARVTSDPQLPRYLDLGYYQTKDSVPFTQPSNLLAALHQALQELNLPQRLIDIARQRAWLLAALASIGLHNFVAEAHAASAIITLRLPENLSARQLGRAMEQQGLLLSYNSEYLLARNLLQICLMGHLTDESCQRLAQSMLAHLSGTSHSNPLSHAN